MLRSKGVLLAVAWCWTAVVRSVLPAPAEGELGLVKLMPISSGRGCLVTFGHAFEKGDVPGSVSMSLAGQPIEAQVDSKRHYEDGSLKHAVITAYLPVVTEGQAVTLALGPARAQPQATPVSGLPEQLEAQVVFDFPDGSRTVADLRQTFRRAQAQPVMRYRFIKWLEGPLVTEYQVSGPPTFPDGKPDPDLWVTFGVRVYRGMGVARVEVVVENSWVDSPGNLPYSITITLDGKKVYAKQDVGHIEGELPWWLKTRDLGHSMRARWRKLFWWGRPMPEMQAQISLPRLVETGLIPRYDTSIAIDKQVLDEEWQRWQSSPRDILENGLILPYFPSPGGREELGPLPTWAARYLLSQDYHQLQVVLGMADLAGGCPVHVRDRRTGRIVSLDDHPGYSTLERATVEVIPRRDAKDRPWIYCTTVTGDDGMPTTSRFVTDNAHQASFAYLPYLLTGDYYYLEEMYFWGNWCILWHPPDYRDRDKGLLRQDQVRGQAWGFRQLTDAAKMAPDGSFEVAYFDDKVKHNLDWYYEFVTGPEASPLGTYTLASDGGYPRFLQDVTEEYRNSWITHAPWQQNFLVWAFENAVQAGYTRAIPVRDYFARLQVGMLTHSDDYDPVNASAYFICIGRTESGKTRFFSTWKELYHETFEVFTPRTVEGAQVQQYGPRGPDYGGSYDYIARAICTIAKRSGLPSAQDAIEYLDTHTVPQRLKVWSRDPTWALTP